MWYQGKRIQFFFSYFDPQSLKRVGKVGKGFNHDIHGLVKIMGPFPRSPEPKSGAQRDHLASCHDITLGLATTLATTGGGHIYAFLIITGWCLAISPEQMRSAYADHHLHGNLRFSASGRHLNTSHSKTVHRQFTFQFSHLCFNNLSLLFVRISSILVSTWPKLLGT